MRSKKFLIIAGIVIVIFVSVFAAKAMYSRIPNLHDYSAQKAYAQKAHNQAQRTSEEIFFSPNIIIGEFLKWTIGENSWEKSVKAQLYLINKYPEKVKDDVDVYGWLGDSYKKLRQSEKARGTYEKQLEIFKRLYYKKQYPERAHLSDTRTLIEEIRYIVRAHYNIAASYNAQKRYDDAIKQYDAAIAYIDDLGDIKPFAWDDIFLSTFRSRGKIYKVIFKEYEKAIKNYKEMKSKIHASMAMSEADILIGDTYLAQGQIEKAKKIYRKVVDDYKTRPIGQRGNYDTAEKRLRQLDNGETIVAIDGVVYKIENGKVDVSLT